MSFCGFIRFTALTVPRVERSPEQIEAQIVRLLNSFELKKEPEAKCPDYTKGKYPQKGKNDLRTKEELREKALLMKLAKKTQHDNSNLTSLLKGDGILFIRI
jgi:hypothetical protein